MSLTPEQKRRKAEELKRRQQNLQGGSMSYYVEKADSMVEPFQPSQDTWGSDSSSDGGGSCD